MDIEPLEAPVDSEGEDSDGDDEPSEELIELVASQANVSVKEAEKALRAENNELVNAIMRLTMSAEDQAESDRLDDLVMTQILSSGKPQEKEEKEKETRRERREAREKEWLDQRVDTIYNRMWSYIQTYSYSILKTDGQPTAQTAWYITDEVGSAICHSSDPNVVVLPFIFSRGSSGMIPYSVFFPVKDIPAGEIITCDLVPKNLERDSDKLAYLFAFEDRVLLDSEIQTKRDQLTKLYSARQAELKNKTFTPPAGKILSSQEALEALKKDGESVSKKDTVTVCTDTSFVQQFLKLDNVKFTNNPASADIVWTSQDFQGWDSLEPHQTVNQFPNEKCITFKHNMAELIQ